MNRLFACTFALLAAGAPLDAARPHCTLRAHLEANANDGARFSSIVQSRVNGRQVVIEKVPTISERDVVAFRSVPAGDGTFGVLFQLGEHGKLALDTLSVERRGTFLHVFVNGRPAAELQIDRRITDGQLYVASGLTAADVALMRKEWPIIGARRPRS